MEHSKLNKQTCCSKLQQSPFYVNSTAKRVHLFCQENTVNSFKYRKTVIIKVWYWIKQLQLWNSVNWKKIWKYICTYVYSKISLKKLISRVVWLCNDCNEQPYVLIPLIIFSSIYGHMYICMQKRYVFDTKFYFPERSAN